MISLPELKELQSDWLDATNEVATLNQELAKVRELLADFDKWKNGKLGVEEYYGLKYENEEIISALHLIYDLTEGHADGAPDATPRDRMALEISSIASKAIDLCAKKGARK